MEKDMIILRTAIPKSILCDLEKLKNQLESKEVKSILQQISKSLRAKYFVKVLSDNEVTSVKGEDFFDSEPEGKDNYPLIKVLYDVTQDSGFKYICYSKKTNSFSQICEVDEGFCSYGNNIDSIAKALELSLNDSAVNILDYNNSLSEMFKRLFELLEFDCRFNKKAPSIKKNRVSKKQLSKKEKLDWANSELKKCLLESIIGNNIPGNAKIFCVSLKDPDLMELSQDFFGDIKKQINLLLKNQVVPKNILTDIELYKLKGHFYIGIWGDGYATALVINLTTRKLETNYNKYR